VGIAPKWNIAHSPDAWEMMFNEVPSDALGLQWEPCHQMVSLNDPLPQLRKWVGKVFNVHGKDATIAWDVVRAHGIRGNTPYVWHRTPGFGDTNWTDVISILRMNGYKGSIDIEAFTTRLQKRARNDRPGSRPELFETVSRRRFRAQPQIINRR
jgi:sugar phosphate isomerase/epimerase